MAKSDKAASWRARQGPYGDWSVVGRCVHKSNRNDCDGSCNVAVSSGLFENEARHVAGLESIKQVREYCLSLPDQRFKMFMGVLEPNLDCPSGPFSKTPLAYSTQGHAFSQLKQGLQRLLSK